MSKSYNKWAEQKEFVALPILKPQRMSLIPRVFFNVWRSVEHGDPVSSCQLLIKEVCLKVTTNELSKKKFRLLVLPTECVKHWYSYMGTLLCCGLSYFVLVDYMYISCWLRFSNTDVHTMKLVALLQRFKCTTAIAAVLNLWSAATCLVVRK